MYVHNNRIYLSEHNGHLDDLKNLIIYDDYKFKANNLSKHFKTSKGANSSVFKLTEVNDEFDDCVIKISNQKRLGRKQVQALNRWQRQKYNQHINRFLNEMDVLNKLNESKSVNIVKYFFNGEVTIDGYQYPFYVMEKADTDLKDYLCSHEVDEQQKFEYCYEIFKGIKDLNDNNYYHRDIKPDNILLFSTNTEENNYVWKIGDLGLVGSRENDYDFEGEKIGPLGWMSPEAINKWMTEKFEKFNFDCVIDDKSDVFQLGKMFYYIYMGTIPVGLLTIDDFQPSNERIEHLFRTICEMLQQEKGRRINLDQLEVSLNSIREMYGL